MNAGIVVLPSEWVTNLLGFQGGVIIGGHLNERGGITLTIRHPNMPDVGADGVPEEIGLGFYGQRSTWVEGEF